MVLNRTGASRSGAATPKVITGGGPDVYLRAITGADGFVGSALCAHWRETGVAFRGLVRALSASTAARPDMLPVGDLTAITDAALANALRDARVVVHLAGRAHVMREAASDPRARFRAINVAATERVARAAASVGTGHFVFASSVKVNGESSPPGYALREDDPPDPRDDYAASKWEAERALVEVARETGMPVTILRLPLLYGPGVKGNVARLTEAIARGVPLPLARIRNRRSLLGAGNLVSAMDALLSAPAPAAHSATAYFLADAAPVSTPEFARAIAAAIGVEARLVPVPLSLLQSAGACVGQSAAVGRLTGSLVVDTAAFCSTFAWQASRSLAKELADMARARSETGPPPL